MAKTIKKHYVYLYKSPQDGVPIYVGKGWGDRAWHHVEIAARNPEQHRNKHFSRTLAKWLRDGLKVEPEIVKEFDTHESALEHEMVLIRYYGRKNIKTGTLLNLTDGGEGTAGRGSQLEVDDILFPTIREACIRYGQNESALRNRINLYGYTIRQAFGLDPAPVYQATGSKPLTVGGEMFPSINAACVHFGLSHDVVSARLNRTDWNFEQIFGLEPPPEKHGPNAIPLTVGDEEFPSLNAACKALVPHLKPATVKARVHPKGWTVEQAFELEPPPKNKGGPKKGLIIFGKHYQSVAEAAREFGIGADTVSWRMKRLGWPIEKALTEKVDTLYRVGDLQFKHFSAACEHFGVSRQLVNWRIEKGWAVEDAFKQPR